MTAVTRQRDRIEIVSDQYFISGFRCCHWPVDIQGFPC